MQQPSPLILLLKKVWPSVYRIINGGLYFVVHLGKILVSRSIDQIRGLP